MARILEIQATQLLPPVLQVQVGDLLVFGAGGGRCLEGEAVIELLGIFSNGLLSQEGDFLSPAGSAMSTVFRAVTAGHARIEVITGDPWQSLPQRTHIAIDVSGL